MSSLASWVKETVSGTPGTGTITLGGAYSSSFIKFSDAFTTGTKVIYEINDGADREEGIGTVTTGAPWTLSRDTILRTLVSGTYDDTSPAALNLTSAALVGCSATADSLGIVVGSAYAALGTVLTCNTVVPLDNTIHQNTEGTEVITVAYTPKFADSKLQVQAGYWGAPSANGLQIQGSIFRDSTADALATTSSSSIGAAEAQSGVVFVEVDATATTATTFKLRVGPHSGTFYVNGSSAGAQYFGGVGSTYIKVIEVRQ